MKNKSHIILIVAIALCSAFATELRAQPKALEGKKVEKSRGDSKYQRPSEDVAVAKPDKTRGACCLEFSNYTGYYIDVWVDNVYQGRISPWADGSVCVVDGWTTYYAETAGGTYYWSDQGTCNGASWTFNLKL